MGLDMYLNARKYVGKYDYSEYDRTTDEWPPPIDQLFSSIEAEAPTGLTKYSDFGGIEVSYPVAYWRKANAIHGWFVSECAGGVDECQPIYVSRDKLVELRDLCKSAVSQPAMAGDILPPTPGFFFGSYEVDEWYMEDLKHTVEMLDHILSLVPEEEFDWSFIYQASW
jgi:hypothetical protein